MIKLNSVRYSAFIPAFLIVCLSVSCVLPESKDKWEEFEGDCQLPVLNEIDTSDFSAEEKEAFDAIDRLFTWYQSKELSERQPQAVEVFPRMNKIVDLGEPAVRPLLEIIRMGNRHPIEQIWSRQEVSCYVMAAMMLGRLEADGAVDDLLIMASRPGHRESRLRAAAIKALGEIGDPRAVPVVRKALDDHFESVREAAKETMEELRSAASE